MPRNDSFERMPSLAELRAFVVVADELHFTRAARRLKIAPPSLSQAIRRLEASLDAVPLERTPRNVRLTDAGAPPPCRSPAPSSCPPPPTSSPGWTRRRPRCT